MKADTTTGPIEAVVVTTVEGQSEWPLSRKSQAGAQYPHLAVLRRRASDPSNQPHLSDLGAAEFKLLRRIGLNGEAATLVETDRSRIVADDPQRDGSKALLLQVPARSLPQRLSDPSRPGSRRHIDCPDLRDIRRGSVIPASPICDPPDYVFIRPGYKNSWRTALDRRAPRGLALVDGQRRKVVTRNNAVICNAPSLDMNLSDGATP